LYSFCIVGFPFKAPSSRSTALIMWDVQSFQDSCPCSFLRITQTFRPYLSLSLISTVTSYVRMLFLSFFVLSSPKVALVYPAWESQGHQCHTDGR